MEFKFTKKYSKKDHIRGIVLPKILSCEFAEVLGVISGDGHLDYNKKYKSTIMNKISIAGNYSEDLEYYKNYFDPLFHSIFNINFSFSLQRKNELCLNIWSKALAYFLKEAGIMPGKKVDINIIPNIILDADDSMKKAFVRGIFDTESSLTFKKDKNNLHSKPIVSLKMKSGNFIFQIRKILQNLGIFSVYYVEKTKDNRTGKTYVGHRIDIAGKKKLTRFLKIVGFRNPRYITKLEIYKKFGFYPPRLDYSQRLNILEGKINPHKFYN